MVNFKILNNIFLGRTVLWIPNQQQQFPNQQQEATSDTTTNKTTPSTI